MQHLQHLQHMQHLWRLEWRLEWWYSRRFYIFYDMKCVFFNDGTSWMTWFWDVLTKATGRGSRTWHLCIRHRLYPVGTLVVFMAHFSVSSFNYWLLFNHTCDDSLRRLIFVWDETWSQWVLLEALETAELLAATTVHGHVRYVTTHDARVRRFQLLLLYADVLGVWTSSLSHHVQSCLKAGNNNTSRSIQILKCLLDHDQLWSIHIFPDLFTVFSSQLVDISVLNSHGCGCHGFWWAGLAGPREVRAWEDTRFHPCFPMWIYTHVWWSDLQRQYVSMYLELYIYMYMCMHMYIYIYIICIWICVYVYTVMYNTHAYVYMRYSISISTTCYQSNQTQHTYLSMLPHVSLDCLGLPTLGISLQPSTWTWASQRWKPIPGQWFHGNIHSMVIVNSYGCIYTLAFSNCW